MINLQRLLIVALAIGCLGLAVGCSSTSAPTAVAPASTQTRSLATSMSDAAAATPTSPDAPAAPVTTTSATVAAALPVATATRNSAGAPAPVQVASAIAVASAIVQRGVNPAVAKIDPCILLTREAAEAAASTTLAELRQYSDTTGPACEYASDSSEVSVTITALPSGGRRVYDDSSTGYGQSRTAVAGVGDQAFVVKGLGVMYVLNGDTLLTLQLVSLKLSGDETAAALTTMARFALRHL